MAEITWHRRNGQYVSNIMQPASWLASVIMAISSNVALLAFNGLTRRSSNILEPGWPQPCQQWRLIVM